MRSMQTPGRSRAYWLVAVLVTALGIYLGLSIQAPPRAAPASAKADH